MSMITKKIFKHYLNMTMYFCWFTIPFEYDVVLLFKKKIFFISKDALCQIWSKSVLCLWEIIL